MPDSLGHEDPHFGYEDIRFWGMVTRMSRRTIACHPDVEERLLQEIEVRGLDTLITVVANPWVPEGRVFIMDSDAMEATLNELLSKTTVLRTDTKTPPAKETDS